MLCCEPSFTAEHLFCFYISIRLSLSLFPFKQSCLRREQYHHRTGQLPALA